MRTLLCGWALVGSLQAGCIGIDGDRVLASHLAPRAPVFARLAPDTEIGPGPLPGVTRWFRGAELQRIAARLGIGRPEEEAWTDLCVEVVAAPLQAERVREALTKALPFGAETEIELLEFSRTPVPDGELEFPASGLTMPARPDASSAVLWRGRIRYGMNAKDYARSLPVWARVRMSRRCQVVLAGRELPAGKVIESADLRTEVRELFPLGVRPMAEIAQAAGRKVRRTVREGEALYPLVLSELKMIERGDTVAVNVASGAARLNFTARAESAGALGARVLLKNPATGNRFHGIVEGRGRARVELSSPLSVEEMIGEQRVESGNSNPAANGGSAR